MSNFELPLRNGDFPHARRKLVGVPNRLSLTQRTRYQPYLNIEDAHGLIGTLNAQELRRLMKWLNRVNL